VLAPGGLFVAIEGTVNSLLQMLTVGFIEGLAQQRAESRLPLLGVPEWRDRLTAAGFARFATVPEGDPAVDVHVQHVLVGQAPVDGEAPGPVALGPSALDDPSTLRGALSQLLPDYMVPRHYLLIDRRPLSPNGKVNLSALPSPWEQPGAAEPTGPRDDLEERLHGIWRDALERDDFGVEGNFFELGGDSLHAVRILGRLREEFGLAEDADQGLEVLFDNPTITELADFLRARVGS